MIVRVLYSILSFVLILLISCRKDVGLKPSTLNIIETHDNFICEDTALNWEKFPNPPWTGYNYFTEKAKETVWRVVYDPVSSNTIYYLTNEGSNFHTLWRYNRITKAKMKLDENILNNINIHKNGWLVYDKTDKNIYKIKSNGDSLRKLTSNGTYLYPSWSDDGSSIFYWDDNDSKGIVYKINTNGLIIDTLKQIYSNIYSIKNYVYYLKLSNNIFYLVQRDLNTNKEINIVTRSVGNSYGESFDNFFANEDNTILYWWGDHGLSKTDLSTLQTTRIVNGGFGSQNQLMQFRRSPINGRFLAIQFNQTLIDSFTIRLTNKIIEFTEDGSCRRTIEIPD